MSHRRGSRSGRTCGLVAWSSAVRSWTRRLALPPSFCNNDPGNDEDHEQQYEEKNNYDRDDDPHRKTGFLASFRLGLLAALNQPIDFRVLREKSLYFFKLRNRRRVVIAPVIIQALTEQRIGWTRRVCGAGTLHILHHRV